MKSRFTYLALSLMVVASMLLTACGGDVTPTTAPVAATATTAPAAATATTGTTAPTTAATMAPTMAATMAPTMAATMAPTMAATMAPTMAATAAATAAAGETVEPTPAPLSTAAAGTKTLRVNIGAEPSTVDPQKMSFVTEIGFGQMVFEALYELDDNEQPVPAAADGPPTISADGLTYTVKVKQGLKYSDGTPLTAANFDYAFRRLFEPTLAGRDYASIAYIIKGSQELSESTETTEAALQPLRDALGVKLVDANTISFTLTQPAAYFPYILAIWVGWPTLESAVKAGGDNWTEPATYIGNGPYILKEWSHGAGAAFEVNPNYRKGTPKIARIEFREINESQVAFQAYQQGELDVVGVAAEDLSTVNSTPALKDRYAQVAGTCNYYIGFNTTVAPFDNVKVRQAFTRAFDRADWVDTIISGLGKPSYTFIPEGFPGYFADTKQADFNAEEAQSMLDEVVASDYPSGLPPIKLTFSNSTRNATRMQWLQDQLLNNLGIEAQLEPVESKAYTELLKENATTPQMYILGWCQDYPDPQNWLSLVFRSDTTIGHTGWANAEFDQLTIDADKNTDPASRLQQYHDASKILSDEAPVVFFYGNTSNWLISSKLAGGKENVKPTDNLIPGFKHIMDLDITQ